MNTTLYLKNSFGLWCTSSPRKVKKVNSLDLLKPAKIMNIFMKRGRDKKNIAYNMRGGLLKCLTSLKVFFSSQKWSDFDLGLRSWTANKWSNFNYYSFIWLMTVLYFKRYNLDAAEDLEPKSKTCLGMSFPKINVLK